MAHGHWKRLGDGSLLTEDADEGLGHIVPLKTYITILCTLLGLTVFTVAIAQVDFGEMNAVVALLVASVKALLVASFFMHLKFEGKLIIMFAIYPLVLLFLFVGSNVADERIRERVYPSFGEVTEAFPVPAAAPVEHH